MSIVPGEVTPPEHLEAYIRISVELWNLRECGATFGIDDLSEGQWCCLMAMVSGQNRATNEKAKETKNNG